MLTMGKLRQQSQRLHLPAPSPDQPWMDGEMNEHLIPSNVQDTWNRILVAMEDTKLILSQEIGKVSAELGHLCTDHHKVSHRVKDTEAVRKDLQPAHQAIKSCISQLTERIQKFEHRAEDAVGHSRRNNVCIVGVPEGVEAPDVVTYLESWARSLLAERPLTMFFELERAHRVPARKPVLGRPPRLIVAKLLHYRDRNLFL
ncbi:hypothetical protein NDU88_007064 [Pleurodeles waltl]|uniref:Uncharacterized protein n=1 Tax=Pleurodeles waltl TaxID=8319 RepID=A0AAV7WEC2_PLEWA|nr:hypothetical protein NDU88_007064 [Pleurodeles waltl]